VLDPAGLRVDLSDFLLGDGACSSVLVENDGAHARRTGIQGNDVRHGKRASAEDSAPAYFDELIGDPRR
jgi:hypothetical protein